MKTLNNVSDRLYLLSFCPSHKAEKRTVKVVLRKEAMTKVKSFKQDHHKKSLFALKSHD